MKIVKKLVVVLVVLFLLGLIGIFVYFNFIQEDKILILTYHGVVEKILDDPAITVDISEQRFEEQIKWLYDNDFKSLSMEEFYEWKVNGKKLPRKSVLITFDDGWSNFYSNAMPILEKYDTKATVFVLWKYSENASKDENIYLTMDQVEDIRKNHPLMEIHSHSYDLHVREKAESQKYDIYDEDMKKVREFDNKTNFYAYPFGERDEQYIRALKDNNFKMAFTFGPYDFAKRSDDNYQVPRYGMYESTQDWKFKLKMILEM